MLFLLSSLVSLALAGTVRSAAPTANTTNGTISGITLDSFGQEAFLGIPFAKPPVGSLRFNLPQPYNQSLDGFTADEYGWWCPGYGEDDKGHTTNEDCLTLNIVRPEGYGPGDNLPVVIWIYGGGFVMGGSADPRYNTSWIIDRSVAMDKPIITVSINYRVSFWGFLESQEVRDEGIENIGLFDQILAFQWVQDNIDNFGGDPSKVTVWGQSAGAGSVAMHILGYGGTLGASLFRGAIMESSTAESNPLRPSWQAQEYFDAIAANVSCANVTDTLQCLREVDFTTLNSTIKNVEHTWMPFVDGKYLETWPSVQMSEWRVAPVAIMGGHCTDDSSAIAPDEIDNTTALTEAIYSSGWYNFTEETIHTLLELYPSDPAAGCPFGSGDGVTTGLQDKRSCALYTDLTQAGPRRKLSQVMTSTGKGVYSFRFDQVTQNNTLYEGVVHFSDVAYVFSNPLPTQNRLSTRPGDSELAELMTSVWVSFIHDLTPNNHGINGTPYWPDYTNEPKNFVFKRLHSWVEEDTYRNESISYINSLPASQRWT